MLTMSSVSEIETAIQKLSVAEQRIIARHLRARLLDAENPGSGVAADEGIRFLPQYDACLGSNLSRRKRVRHHAKSTR